MTIYKIIRVGTTRIGASNASVFVKIKFGGKRLSITGVEGPCVGGGARGGCGQISRPEIVNFAPGWTRNLVKKLWEVWDRWHLNDMRAECKHQRKRGETYETHPSAICSDCGYELGSKWLCEDVPSAILSFLDQLPETDKNPAWV